MSDGACALTEADRLVPLTAAQQGIWAGQRLDPGSPVYFAAEFVELAGKLDVARLAAAIRAVMAKAPALHARFSEVDGEPAQRLAVTDDWALPVLDLGGEAAAVEWMRSRLATSPDLARGPLFEHAVLRVGPQRHFWYLRMHHILADGYAFALLIRSVADAYSGRPVRLGDLAPVLAEDLAYQRDPDMAADRDFWLRYLDGSPDPVTLAAGTAHVSSPIRVRVPLPEPPEGHDPTAGPIAAVAALLDREEVVLGLPVMGRFGSAALRVPCMLMNIVPLRVRDTSPEAVSRELELIRPHSRYRYERLRRDLGLVGGERRLFGPVVNLLPFGATPRFDGLTARVHQLSAGPVEDISFAFGKDLVIDANPGLYTVDDLKAHAATLTDLLASGPHRRRHTVLDGGPVPPTAPVLDLIARHDPDRPAVGTTTYGELNRAVSHLADKLTRAGAKPGAIIAVKLPRGVNAVIAALAVLRTGAAYLPLDPAAPPAREAAILADARPTAIIQPHPTTPHDTDKVQPHATTPQHDTQESRPPAVTARHDPRQAEPNPIPSQHNARTSQPIASEHDARETQSHPVASRHDGRETESQRITSQGDGWEMEAYAISVREDAREIEPGIAYVIYTSGSTGTPNGVLVGHEALEHFVAGATVAYGLSADDRVLQFAPLHFDAAIEEIFLTLCAGATLVPRDDAMLDSVPALLAACEAHRITVLDLPTAYWHELAYVIGSAAATLPACVRTVIIGGEAALPERVAQWRRAVGPNVRLLNTYGPTEATVVATYADLSTSDGAPIGRPLPGVRAAIRHGELWLQGGGLARGYLDRPELTARRFTTLDGSPAYRTGDLVRAVNGELHYLGRADDELKISGYRIDPAAIESVLLTHRDVREAAVVPQRLPADGTRLVAFIATAPDARTGTLADPGSELVGGSPANTRSGAEARSEPLTDARADVGTADRDVVADLAGHCARALPAAAVPVAFVVLPRLPRTGTGKIDRRALRDHVVPAPAAEAEHTSGPERVILDVWHEVLGARLGRQDDFFLRGGQSLQTIQVAARLTVALGRQVPVRLLFDHPTAASLAAALTTAPEAMTRDLIREATLPADIAPRPTASSADTASQTQTHNPTHKAAMPTHTGPHTPAHDLSDTAVPAGTTPQAPTENPSDKATLAADIAPPETREAELPAGSAPTYLLTGATGFIGAHLLAALLRRTPAQVVCLVRGDSDTHARQRVVDALRGQGLAGLPLDRVTVHATDLTRIPDALAERLASTVDAVYHCAAQVSVVRGYDSLRPANVDATIALLRIAAAHRPSAFHHISTVAVGPAWGVPEEFVACHDGLADGYQQSKWVAEELVRQARRRGLAAHVYRLARVTGATTTGIVNPDDLIWRVLRAGLPHGLLPDLDVSEAWTPVDLVAEAVVELSAQPTQTVYNISSAAPVSFKDVLTWLREHGYRFETVAPARWPSMLPDPDPDTRATLAFFEGPPPVPPGPVHSSHDTPAVAADLMRRYLADAVTKGHLPRHDAI